MGADLGFVGAGMPTTEEEAKEFAANVADPVRHLNQLKPASSTGRMQSRLQSVALCESSRLGAED
jgi:hypothetical protein